MNILLFGATGNIGSRILAEATTRGHDVTAVARDTSALDGGDHVRVESADASNDDAVADLAEGHDAIVASLSPRGAGGGETYLDAIRVLLAAQQDTGAGRVLIVGGAGSLKVGDGGTELIDTPEFPDEYREESELGREARDLAQASGANWTVFSPAMIIEPGERTNDFRIGGDRLITDEDGGSRITMEDFAVALVDELEDPQYERAQFTAAY